MLLRYSLKDRKTLLPLRRVSRSETAFALKYFPLSPCFSVTFSVSSVLKKPFLSIPA